MKRLVDALQPGQRVFVSTLSTESALLRDELLADPERARDVTFCGVQFPGIDRTDYLALHPQARLVAHFMSPAVRRVMAEGTQQARAELLSQDYLGIARLLLDEPPVDLAIAQLTPPDADGWCSPGLACDFMPLVWTRARSRIAHLNPRLPRTRGSFRVHASEMDFVVEADVPLLSFADPRSGEVETRIGQHVATLVRDGDTLQFGIGSVPAALAHSLTGHRGLRFHGGMLPTALQRLWEASAMDRDAPITTGVVLGDPGLHDFVTRLEPLWMTDVTHTHGAAALAAIPRLVAINTAVEVDLFGQVNSERAGGVIQAGAGGLPAFAQGALASPGGRLLICLPASARKGAVSRIVPALASDALCTLPRTLTDVVVTEHGVAELRGRSLDARAQALIAIAAPEHRPALATAWDDIRRNA